MSAGEMPADVRRLADQARGVETPAPAREHNGEAPTSLIADLREQHRRIRRRKHTVIELPYGLWAGKLAVRYRLLDDDGLGKMLRAVQTAEGEQLLEANADILISACVEVLARRDTDQPWGPLVDDEHLRFEPRLAELLELGGADSARQVLYALYGGRTEGALAINDQAASYIAWAQGKTPEVVSELEGESHPARS